MLLGSVSFSGSSSSSLSISSSSDQPGYLLMEGDLMGEEGKKST
jgi:hypothetical protein